MNRVLLDANLLLLYLVGNRLSGWQSWKRLAAFDEEDLKRLNREVGRSSHVTLPNILTEASNLLGAKAQESVADGWLLLAEYARLHTEIYKPSDKVVENEVYERLGLTDAAIFWLACEQVKVLTVDFELANRLAAKRLDVVNLRHFKTPKGRR